MASPSFTNGQALIFSYSYENVTRNNGGGTLENGDIIEVHALVKVNAPTKNFYYVDTVGTGTSFVNGSLKLVTNEGVLFDGPYTDNSNDDKGVYDISNGIPRIRINIGSVAALAQSGTAGFGSTSGGGTVNPGDKPKFYGTTLFMVAYQLKITANFGDTIHLTGNYYFDTANKKTDNIKTLRFTYPGIKIIQNSGFCTNFSSASFTADSSFGTGATQNRALAAIVPSYTKIILTSGAPQDGYYSIVNNTSPTQKTSDAGPHSSNPDRVFNFWDIIGDHTGASDPTTGNSPTAQNANGGYMLVVNAAYPTGEAFRQTIYDVCPNTNYEFSAWVRNICGFCGLDVNGASSNSPGVLPNLSFAINDIDYYTSGDIPWDKTWKKRGFMYKTGPNETSFTISIKNNAAGGGGNDWVLDDIKLATCYPNLIMNPNDTAAACSGSPISVTDTVKSYFNNYNFYRWEKSSDGINWIPLTAGNTKTPVLQNGLYLYYVDTVFKPNQIDSGTFLRLKVATSLDNLTDGKCAVNNSQKVFLKVYTAKACPILESRILNFNGTIINDRSLLKWTCENEDKIQEYEIEKSIDGIHFSTTGKVLATKGRNEAGYSFTDQKRISNAVYYRLKLITADNGNNKYSKIIALYNGNSAFKIIAVNPFKNILKLDVFLPNQGNIEFNLCDIYGNVVNRNVMQLQKGNSELSFNVDNLPAGIYILRAVFNGSVFQNKLIKTN